MADNASLPASTPRRRMAMHWQVLLGLILGAAVGMGANRAAFRPIVAGQSDPRDVNANSVDDRLESFAANVTDPVGKIFLRLILMVVIPLVFSALALGAVGLGDVRRVGRVGLRTLGYTLLLSTTAVFLGVGLVNLIGPGRGLDAAQQESLRRQYEGAVKDAVVKAKAAKHWPEVLIDVIPENPLQEMVGAMDGSSKGHGLLAVMFFALAVGAAITFVRDQTQVFVSWLEGLQAIAMTIIGWAMRLAPLAVACLVFGVAARLGTALVAPLAGFAGTVLLGLGIQLLVVYPLALRLIAGSSPLRFFRGISDAILTAFGTSSSNATLPTSLRVAEENLALPGDVSRFVLTVGATGNQNGTALYEGVVVLFLAQVFHVDLTLGQQFMVVVVSILAGVGTAGVPGASLPMLVVVLQWFDIPAEGIGLILGIDRLLDMSRTVLNVTGDLTIAACVARPAIRT